MANLKCISTWITPKLFDDLNAYIKEQGYTSKSEFLREAVRLKMNGCSLSPEQKQKLQRLIEEGKFTSVSDVLREALNFYFEYSADANSHVPKKELCTNEHS